MTTARAILIVGILVVATMLLLGRYEFVPRAGFNAYVLDRWSGEVWLYNAGGYRFVGPHIEITEEHQKPAPGPTFRNYPAGEYTDEELDQLAQPKEAPR